MAYRMRKIINFTSNWDNINLNANMLPLKSSDRIFMFTKEKLQRNENFHVTRNIN